MQILQGIGQVATEVRGSHDDVRAFVTVYLFSPEIVPGATDRYRYLGQHPFLYHARRFQLSCEILERDLDVSEEDLWDSQRIVLPDEASLELVLRLWLPDLEALVEPRLTDIPI